MGTRPEYQVYLTTKDMCSWFMKDNKGLQQCKEDLRHE